jgi:hypothetical protein
MLRLKIAHFKKIKNMNPRNAELSAITQVINKYAEGCQTGDIALLREAFHPQAMMYGSSGEQTIVAPIEGLYAFVEANEPPAKTGEPHQCFISSIQYNGNAASVEMIQESGFGHDYTNYFQLVRVDGQWVIVSKTYNASPTQKEQIVEEKFELQAS